MPGKLHIYLSFSSGDNFQTEPERTETNIEQQYRWAEKQRSEEFGAAKVAEIYEKESEEERHR